MNINLILLIALAFVIAAILLSELRLRARRRLQVRALAKMRATEIDEREESVRIRASVAAGAEWLALQDPGLIDRSFIEMQGSRVAV